MILVNIWRNLMVFGIGLHNFWMSFLMAKSWQFIIIVLLSNAFLLHDLDCSIWDFSFSICIDFSNSKHICFIYWKLSWTRHGALINWRKELHVFKINITNTAALSKLRFRTFCSFLSFSTRWSWWCATNRWFYGLTFLWWQELVHFYHFFSSLWRWRIEHSFFVQERTVISAERVLSLRCSLAYSCRMLKPSSIGCNCSSRGRKSFWCASFTDCSLRGKHLRIKSFLFDPCWRF